MHIIGILNEYFSCYKHPELDALIMRRFSQEGDVEQARNLVAKVGFTYL